MHTNDTRWNSLFDATVKDTGALSSFSDGQTIHASPGEIPSSSQQLKLQEPCHLGRYIRGQGSCCDEEGISPGAACIQMTPAEIPFSVQL